MNSCLNLLSKRKIYSKKRLSELASKINTFEILEKFPDLCIYITGSFGRLEASVYSDLDLFFVHNGKSNRNAVPSINKTLLDASLIQTARELKFPEFSNDGEYLTVHYLDEIKKTLGGPDDDFKNHFTARLLLLLESRSLYNNDVYDEVIGEIIDSYYRDYHTHEKNFRPLFLINDIMRFWRTLCLNYEHRRNRPASDNYRRNKSHINNLKLKFSRLLTCHSAIAMLSIDAGVVDPEKLLAIVKLSPLERLDALAELSVCVKRHVEAIKHEYSWCLEKTGNEEPSVLEWIADPSNREEAFDRGRLFATEMYKVLCAITKGADTMRYLVV